MVYLGINFHFHKLPQSLLGSFLSTSTLRTISKVRGVFIAQSNFFEEGFRKKWVTVFSRYLFLQKKPIFNVR